MLRQRRAAGPDGERERERERERAVRLHQPQAHLPITFIYNVNILSYVYLIL